MTDAQRPRLSRRTLLVAAIVVVVLAVVAAVLIPLAVRAGTGPAVARSTSSASARPTATPTSAPYTAPAAAAVATLPEARYNAVLAGLIPYTGSTVSAASAHAATIDEDAPLYGDDRTVPVARLAAKNFLGNPTVIVPVRVDGDWTEILTPSRQQLPSAAGGHAAAQTAAWIRSSLLHEGTALTDHLAISVSKQTVSIVDASGTVSQSFPAGVGASGTPTPTGVVGYIQARYLDPAQGQTVHEINLTSLHSAAADEPYGGNDGGLIGVHYEPQATGDISHGCVRLSASAIDIVNTLPLGTLVEITA
ncbi:L,D-transpeptidase [Curtobacterium sp. RRHDQ10]|uniref:L,D-transpeptidase n=1 Tax=Curtobacterium phyllosphaerae TaxID=3413379 RepID=UPI003BF1E4E1